MKPLARNIQVFAFVVQLISLANAALYLYEGYNFQRPMGSFPVNQHCRSLPSTVHYRINSLKTDECIILFEHPGCSYYAYDNYNVYGSIKVLAGEYHHKNGIPGMTVLRQNALRSYRQCDSSFGGPKTHVRLYDRYGNTLVDYDNICRRIQVPSYAEYSYRLDNYGSCIKVEIQNTYYKNNYTQTFYGGATTKTLLFNSPSGSLTQRLLSIAPCNPALTCMTLNAIVTSFEIEDMSATGGVRLSDLSMGATTMFINNGSATVSQDYTASKKVVETSIVTLTQGASRMNSWSVSKGVASSYSLRVPFVSKGKVETSLSTAYTRQQQSNEWSNTQIRQVETEFRINQKIQIEACTKYEVSSYVRMTQGYPMKYRVTYEVTGTNGEHKPLHAYEIKDNLGRTYIKNKNDWTAIASETGTIYVDFGLESIISGKGEKIEGCLTSVNGTTSVNTTTVSYNSTTIGTTVLQ